MEYMSAGSLQDIVLKGGCQNEMILSRIALGVLHGLAHIHKKYMVHRDIKPHNLLMNRQGEVKISDFGLARTLTDTVSSTKTFVGTLLYMAPERIGGGDYSYSADIWSFGLVLISVALGRYPLPTQDGFFGLVDSVANEKYLQLPVDIYSKDCRDFIENCLRIDPKERLTAEQLLQHPFVNKYSENETFVEVI
jgi:serine/threonine protein kinase